MPDTTQARRVLPPQEMRGPLTLAALAILGLMIWRLADVILLALGAVLVASLLHAIAGPLQRRLGMRRPLALSAAVAAMTAAILGTVFLFGQQIVVQAETLQTLIPRAWVLIEGYLQRSTLGAPLLADLRGMQLDNAMLMRVGSRLLGSSATAAAGTMIVLFAGLYLAFHPQTYLGGLLKLAPVASRERVGEVLSACGYALRQWLIGQVISMILVGVTVTGGLWIAGVPSPLALGVVAGLGQFVPIVGPAVSTLPGLVVAAGESPQTLFWALVVYVGAMQFEANVVTPWLLSRMVEVPMAVTLFAVLAMGVLFGGLGVVFATPLVVIAHVLVRMVYVEGILGDRPPPSPPDEARRREAPRPDRETG